ncbi:MAG TPA: ACP S-malonyltransferase [Candidatus Dormibacteraeota bacterium]|nr:ACP S-malonyltransferase [Candidatus Dormibacteraeota bacterium]
MFPGQGAQFVGMARDLIEKDDGTGEFLKKAEDLLNLPLGRLMVEGPGDELQKTENAQPAITFHSLALLRKLVDAGITPDAVAGHSLGEFAGLVAAGGLEPIDALLAVRARGRAMAAAAPGGTGMVAVLGLDDAAVDRVCAEVQGVVPANYNAPGQVVISGSNDALEAVTPRLQEAGARRLVRLPVSAAFHSPLMKDAAAAFAETWDAITLRRLERPQVFNADAAAHAEPGEIRPLMVGQLTGPVRWTQSVRRLRELGASTFVEIGPGRTLTGLVKKIVPEAVLHNIEDMASLTAFLQAEHA